MAMDNDQQTSHCHLTEPAQIGALLQSLCDRQIPISLRLEDSTLYSASSVLSVDKANGRIVLDASAAPAVNACLARSPLVHVHAELDKVQVHFVLAGLDDTQLEQDKVFTARFPQRLLHLQRRELYRLSTPLSHWPECEINLGDDAGANPRLRVADIGAGGMALLHALEAVHLPLGQQLPCLLHIPDGPSLEIDIRVCNDRVINTADGRELRRTGVAFQALAPAAQKHVSRYIFALDRLRNARRQGKD